MMKRYFGIIAVLCALAGSVCAQNTTTFGNIVSMGVPCGAANCVYYQLPQGTPWVTVTVTGTWAGTLETSTSSAPNANYSNLDTIAWTVLGTGTANGTWSAATSGATYLRVRATSWTSGSAQVAMASSQSQAPLLNPLFPGIVTASGLQMANGGSATNCWLTNGSSANCSSVLGGPYLPSAGGPITGPVDTFAAAPVFQGLVQGTSFYEAGYVRVVGKYAYVTAHGASPGAFNVVDISVPTSPALISSITSTQMSNGAEGLECVGTYCYVTTAPNNSFVVIDISNAKAPAQVGYITDATHLHATQTVAVSGHYAFTGTNLGSTIYLSVLDISNPTAPALLNSVTSADLNSGVAQVGLKGRYLYVVTNSGVFSIWDASALPALTEVAHTATLIGADFFLGDRYAYVINGVIGSPSSSTLSVIDISNPTVTPVVVGSVTTLNTVEWTIKCAGNYCYVTDAQQNGLMVFNVSNPAAPTLVAEIFDNTNLLSIDDIFLSGDYAYIANNGSGTTGSLAIYRITGENFTAASIGNLQAGDANVDNTLVVGKDLTVKNGINVGLFGVNSNGPIVSSGSVKASSAGASIGYETGTGTGCAVTQLTSRATGVTCTNNTGEITMFSAAGSTTAASFTVTDTAVLATDCIGLTQQGGTNTYELFSKVAAGSFVVTFLTTGGTAIDAPTINFGVTKCSAN